MFILDFPAERDVLIKKTEKNVQQRLLLSNITCLNMTYCEDVTPI